MFKFIKAKFNFCTDLFRLTDCLQVVIFMVQTVQVVDITTFF